MALDENFWTKGWHVYHVDTRRRLCGGNLSRSTRNVIEKAVSLMKSGSRVIGVRAMNAFNLEPRGNPRSPAKLKVIDYGDQLLLRTRASRRWPGLVLPHGRA